MLIISVCLSAKPKWTTCLAVVREREENNQINSANSIPMLSNSTLTKSNVIVLIFLSSLSSLSHIKLIIYGTPWTICANFESYAAWWPHKSVTTVWGGCSLRVRRCFSPKTTCGWISLERYDRFAPNLIDICSMTTTVSLLWSWPGCSWGWASDLLVRGKIRLLVYLQVLHSFYRLVPNLIDTCNCWSMDGEQIYFFGRQGSPIPSTIPNNPGQTC